MAILSYGRSEMPHISNLIPFFQRITTPQFWSKGSYRGLVKIWISIRAQMYNIFQRASYSRFGGFRQGEFLLPRDHRFDYVANACGSFCDPLRYEALAAIRKIAVSTAKSATAVFCPFASIQSFHSF